MITVSVVLAMPHRQQRVVLQVAAGMAARDVLSQAVEAGLDLAGTGLNADTVALAVHGECIDAWCTLAEGDRLELLRPLRQAPMELRRQRAGAGKRR